MAGMLRSGIVVSAANSTSAPLAAGGAFAGPFEDVRQYQEVSLNIAGAPSICPGTIFFEFSPDGVNADVSVPTPLDGPSTVPLFLRVVLPYFRVRYENGAAPQTTFRLTTVYHLFGAARLTRFLNQSMNDTEPVEVTRSVIAGARPDGTYDNVPLNRQNNLEISIADVGPVAEERILGADKATFGGAVFVARLSQIRAQFEFPIASQGIRELTAGTGNITQSGGYARVATGAGATSSASIESLARTQYFPGREVYAIYASDFTTPTSANSNMRCGIVDGQNGYFVGYRGLVFGLTVRSAGVDYFTPQADFNGDKLDGNPNSQFLRGDTPEPLNPAAADGNVWRIRFGWLGGSPTQFEIMSPNGPWVTFHTVRLPNSSLPRIDTPNLPLRAEVEKSGADATDIAIKIGSWDAGVAASPSEDPIGFVSVVNATSTPLAAGATYTGSWERTSGAVTILASSLSDVDSAALGWRVEWSMDGVTMLFAQALSAQANRVRAVTFNVRAAFFRFVYVNGPVAQGAFVLQVVLQNAGSGLTTQLLSQSLTEDNVAAPIRSVTAAKSTADGVFRNVTGETVGAVYAAHVDGSKFTQPVSAVSLPLPTGAATEATLALIKAKTDNLDVALSTRSAIASTQPVSAASLPLPAGAATAALQTAGNASLAAIDADLGPAASYRHLNANGSTTLKTGAGRLRSVVINKIGTGSNTLTLTDGAAVIAVIDTTVTAAPQRVYNISFATNLVAVLAANTAADVTIIFD